MKDAVRDSAKKGLRVFETGLKEIWSRLDAASEKERPSDRLSGGAIRAIQGRAGNDE